VAALYLVPQLGIALGMAVTPGWSRAIAVGNQLSLVMAVIQLGCAIAAGQNTESLGLQIVNILSSQLNGTLTLERAAGRASGSASRGTRATNERGRHRVDRRDP